MKSRSITLVGSLFAITLLLGISPPKGYTDTPPTTTLSIDASATMGSNGWYTSAVPVTLTAVAGTNPLSSITHWIDSGTKTTATDNPVVRTLVTQGTHTLNYYASDSAGVQEATRSFGYKIDIVAPGSWTGFTLNQQGNAHTFSISVSVTDKTSGIDPATAEFQYSVDDGVNWGYYSNLTQCNSTWNSNLWRTATVSPNTAGTNTVTVNIPATDYCNSNWQDTKYIRIRIKDMAGLTASKQYALMSPWMRTSGGDIYSQGTIDMITEQGTSATGVVITGTDTQNNLTSAQGWSIKNYSIDSQPLYTQYYSKLGSQATTLPNTFPTTSGIYRTDDKSLTSVPNALSSAQNKAIIVFVSGDLFIDTNVTLHRSSNLIWIVSGDIGIKNNVERADGIYISDGQFRSAYTQSNGNGGSDDELLLYGTIIAHNGISLDRSLNGNDNLTNPAEEIIFSPGLFVNPALASVFKVSSAITWKEYISY